MSFEYNESTDRTADLVGRIIEGEQYKLESIQKALDNLMRENDSNPTDERNKRILELQDSLQDTILELAKLQDEYSKLGGDVSVIVEDGQILENRHEPKSTQSLN